MSIITSKDIVKITTSKQNISCLDVLTICPCLTSTTFFIALALILPAILLSVELGMRE